MKKRGLLVLSLTFFYTLGITSAESISIVDKVAANSVRILQEESKELGLGNWEIYKKRINFYPERQEGSRDVSGLYRATIAADTMLQYFENIADQKEELFFLGRKNNMNQLSFDSYNNPQLFSSLWSKDDERGNKICYFNMDSKRQPVTGFYKESYISCAQCTNVKSALAELSKKSKKAGFGAISQTQKDDAFLCLNSDYKKLLANVRKAKTEQSHVFSLIMTSWCGIPWQGHSGVLLVCTEKDELDKLSVKIFCADGCNVAYLPEEHPYSAKWFLPALARLKRFLCEEDSLGRAIIYYLVATKSSDKAKKILKKLNLTNCYCYKYIANCMPGNSIFLLQEPNRISSAKNLYINHNNYSLGIAFAIAEYFLSGKIDIDTYESDHQKRLTIGFGPSKDRAELSKVLSSIKAKTITFNDSPLPDTIDTFQKDKFLGQLCLNVSYPRTYALFCHEAMNSQAFLVKDEKTRALYQSIAAQIVYLEYNQDNTFKLKSEIGKLLTCQKSDFFVIITNLSKDDNNAWNVVTVHNNKIGYVVGNYDGNRLNNLGHILTSSDFLSRTFSNVFNDHYTAFFGELEKKRLGIKVSDTSNEKENNKSCLIV